MDTNMIDNSNTAAEGEVSSSSSSSQRKKRRHPDSSSSSSSYPYQSKTSLEILQLVENPNFEELARHYPTFQIAWKQTLQKQRESHGSKNFSACITQEFTISLTRGLLQTQFNLRLPFVEKNHLVPPVPNRFFYIHWLHTTVLPSSSSFYTTDIANNNNNNNQSQQQQQQYLPKWGMDIGTGATCIYPLLATRCMHYNMVGTDIDIDALSLAKQNIQANQLDSKIHLLHVQPSHSQDPSLPLGGPLQRGLERWRSSSPLSLSSNYSTQQQQQQQQFDFIMTNPPFYDPNSMEYKTPRAGDGRDRTTMTVSEGNYPGGEVGFVIDMIADSLMSRNSSRWFSSMLGKKSSLIKLQKLLMHILGPGHIHTTEYGPGHYTRWFIAWTFERPLAMTPLARIQNNNNSHDTFQVSTLEDNNTISNPSESAVAEVVSRIRSFCESSPGGWDLEVLEQQQQSTMKVESSSTGTGSNTTTILIIKEAMVLAVTNFVDESTISKNNNNTTAGDIIPEVILSALQGQDNSKFLPEEGHFVIQIIVQASIKPGTVNVQLECYAHSSRGVKAIEKIRSTMEGEVCRTNRRWRRIRQRNSNK